MSDEIFDYIKAEIEYAEGDVGEAAFWAYDALFNGYDNELSKLLNVSKLDSRTAYKVVFNLYHEVYEKITNIINELKARKIVSRQWIINQAKIENGCEISVGITEDFIKLRDKSKCRGTEITELPKGDL